MATLLEMAAEIVSSHASTSEMTTDQLLQEIQNVYASLQALETGIVIEVEDPNIPAITVKQAFKKDEVICMICGKGKMKTLARHLMKEHGLKPGQYRKQFGIPTKQPLTAKSFSAARRKFAEDRGLGDVLAKARETRAANIKAKRAPVPAVRPKPGVPAVRVKAPVPAKIDKSEAAPVKAVKPTAAKKAVAAKPVKAKTVKKAE